jgi:hypothetical protein
MFDGNLAHPCYCVHQSIRKRPVTCELTDPGGGHGFRARKVANILLAAGTFLRNRNATIQIFEFLVELRVRETICDNLRKQEGCAQEKDQRRTKHGQDEGGRWRHAVMPTLRVVQFSASLSDPETEGE